MATRSCAYSKKWCLLARDTFGLNRANTVANDRFQQNKWPVGALSDLQPSVCQQGQTCLDGKFVPELDATQEPVY